MLKEITTNEKLIQKGRKKNTINSKYVEIHRKCVHFPFFT